MSLGRKIVLAIVFLWFLLGGIGHFLLTPKFVQIVPPYVPFPLAVVFISGVLELLGAIGVLWHATRRWAGVGLALLTLAVTPANVYMLQRHDLFTQFPVWALVARLPIQLLLVIGIIWSTKPAYVRRYRKF